MKLFLHRSFWWIDLQFIQLELLHLADMEAICFVGICLRDCECMWDFNFDGNQLLFTDFDLSFGRFVILNYSQREFKGTGKSTVLLNRLIPPPLEHCVICEQPFHQNWRKINEQKMSNDVLTLISPKKYVKFLMLIFSLKIFSTTKFSQLLIAFLVLAIVLTTPHIP